MKTLENEEDNYTKETLLNLKKQNQDEIKRRQKTIKGLLDNIAYIDILLNKKKQKEA